MTGAIGSSVLLLREGTYVELPALDRLTCLLACYHDNELRDLAAGHPFVELRHDFFDVGFDLVVGCDFFMC